MLNRNRIRMIKIGQNAGGQHDCVIEKFRLYHYALSLKYPLNSNVKSSRWITLSADFRWQTMAATSDYTKIDLFYS